MKQEEKKPRELWVYKGTSNFYDELTLDDACENYIRNKPEGFYDIVSEKDTIEGAIHVIEYSAYEQLKKELENRDAVRLWKENEQLKAKLETAKEALKYITAGIAGMFNDGEDREKLIFDRAERTMKEIEGEK